MQVNSMRLLDRWVGVPASAFLTLVRRCADLVRRPERSAPRRIVIVKLVEQGATVIAAPAIQRAIDLVGRENVFFAVFVENRPILDVLGLIPAENVITIRSDGLFVVAIDTIRAIFRLRREQVDTAVDFEFFSRFSGALTYLSGARARIGFHSYAGEAGYRGDLMTHRVAYNIRLHASETYHMLVDAISLNGKDLPTLGFMPARNLSPPQRESNPHDVAQVRQMLSERFENENPGRIVLLNANAGDLLPIRRWADERYVLLAQKLLKHYPDICIALTGAKSEQSGAEALASHISSRRCASVAGYTTLPELFALYSLSDVMVTNDSGPAHYASLTGMDVISLFGPESPDVFGARSETSHPIWAGLACSPCVNAFNQRVTRCSNNVCMQRISVDQVFDNVVGVLERRSNATGAMKVAAR